MANGLQGLTKHLALCLSGGRSGKNRPRYSTTIHLYVCQQVDVEILVISYLRVTQGTLLRTFEGTFVPSYLLPSFGTFVFVIAALHGSEIFLTVKNVTLTWYRLSNITDYSFHALISFFVPIQEFLFFL